MTDKRHWFIRATSTKSKLHSYKFTRTERRRLAHIKSVEDSLDAEFGIIHRQKRRFTNP